MSDWEAIFDIVLAVVIVGCFLMAVHTQGQPIVKDDDE